MWNGHFTRISLGSLLSLAMFFAGCNMNMRAKYQRMVPLSAPLSPGSTFAAQTHNGSITTNGADVADCDMIATITARAATEEQARELAEKIEISLEPSGDRLTAKIMKPTHLINKSVSVSLDVTVPNETNLELETHNGSVRITDVAGMVNATTHNGKVTTERVSGSTVLVTHNGSINCRETSGDAKLKTHNGSAKVFYCETAPAVSDISIVTYNGSIELETPPDFSAKVEAITNNGSINSDLGVTVSGIFSRSRLTGSIGSGEGRLYLETHNGSIRIR
ncbi:MAG: DUF4097 family beta strand repeat-containing protein [Planctomycetota bacterium]|nr:DUF4097 family beta strand repeat-containing protein [Planctomycetota bacterium]